MPTELINEEDSQKALNENTMPIDGKDSIDGRKKRTPEQNMLLTGDRSLLGIEKPGSSDADYSRFVKGISSTVPSEVQSNKRIEQERQKSLEQSALMGQGLMPTEAEAVRQEASQDIARIGLGENIPSKEVDMFNEYAKSLHFGDSGIYSDEEKQEGAKSYIDKSSRQDYANQISFLIKQGDKNYKNTLENKAVNYIKDERIFETENMDELITLSRKINEAKIDLSKIKDREAFNEKRKEIMALSSEANKLRGAFAFEEDPLSGNYNERLAKINDKVNELGESIYKNPSSREKIKEEFIKNSLKLKKLRENFVRSGDLYDSVLVNTIAAFRLGVLNEDVSQMESSFFEEATSGVNDIAATRDITDAETRIAAASMLPESALSKDEKEYKTMSTSEEFGNMMKTTAKIAGEVAVAEAVAAYTLDPALMSITGVKAVEGASKAYQMSKAMSKIRTAVNASNNPYTKTAFNLVSTLSKQAAIGYTTEAGAPIMIGEGLSDFTINKLATGKSKIGKIAKYIKDANGKNILGKATSTAGLAGVRTATETLSEVTGDISDALYENGIDLSDPKYSFEKIANTAFGETSDERLHNFKMLVAFSAMFATTRSTMKTVGEAYNDLYKATGNEFYKQRSDAVDEILSPVDKSISEIKNEQAVEEIVPEKKKEYSTEEEFINSEEYSMFKPAIESGIPDVEKTAKGAIKRKYGIEVSDKKEDIVPSEEISARLDKVIAGWGVGEKAKEVELTNIAPKKEEEAKVKAEPVFDNPELNQIAEEALIMSDAEEESVKIEPIKKEEPITTVEVAEQPAAAKEKEPVKQKETEEQREKRHLFFSKAIDDNRAVRGFLDEYEENNSNDLLINEALDEDGEIFINRPDAKRKSTIDFYYKTGNRMYDIMSSQLNDIMSGYIEIPTDDTGNPVKIKNTTGIDRSLTWMPKDKRDSIKELVNKYNSFVASKGVQKDNMSKEEIDTKSKLDASEKVDLISDEDKSLIRSVNAKNISEQPLTNEEKDGMSSLYNKIKNTKISAAIKDSFVNWVYNNSSRKERDFQRSTKKATRDKYIVPIAANNMIMSKYNYQDSDTAANKLDKINETFNSIGDEAKIHDYNKLLESLKDITNRYKLSRKQIKDVNSIIEKISNKYGIDIKDVDRQASNEVEFRENEALKRIANSSKEDKLSEKIKEQEEKTKESMSDDEKTKKLIRSGFDNMKEAASNALGEMAKISKLISSETDKDILESYNEEYMRYSALYNTFLGKMNVQVDFSKKKGFNELFNEINAEKKTIESVKDGIDRIKEPLKSKRSVGAESNEYAPKELENIINSKSSYSIEDIYGSRNAFIDFIAEKTKNDIKSSSYESDIDSKFKISMIDVYVNVIKDLDSFGNILGSPIKMIQYNGDTSNLINHNDTNAVIDFNLNTIVFFKDKYNVFDLAHELLHSRSSEMLDMDKVFNSRVDKMRLSTLKAIDKNLSSINMSGKFKNKEEEVLFNSIVSYYRQRRNVDLFKFINEGKMSLKEAANAIMYDINTNKLEEKNNFKKEEIGGLFYGLTNSHEFIAEVGDPGFASILASINYKRESKITNGFFDFLDSVFVAIKNAINLMYDKTIGEENILSSLIYEMNESSYLFQKVIENYKSSVHKKTLSRPFEIQKETDAFKLHVENAAEEEGLLKKDRFRYKLSIDKIDKDTTLYHGTSSLDMDYSSQGDNARLVHMSIDNLDESVALIPRNDFNDIYTVSETTDIKRGGRMLGYSYGFKVVPKRPLNLIRMQDSGSNTHGYEIYSVLEIPKTSKNYNKAKQLASSIVNAMKGNATDVNIKVLDTELSRIMNEEALSQGYDGYIYYNKAENVFSEYYTSKASIFFSDFRSKLLDQYDYKNPRIDFIVKNILPVYEGTSVTKERIFEDIDSKMPNVFSLKDIEIAIEYSSKSVNVDSKEVKNLKKKIKELKDKELKREEVRLIVLEEIRKATEKDKGLRSIAINSATRLINTFSHKVLNKDLDSIVERIDSILSDISTAQSIKYAKSNQSKINIGSVKFPKHENVWNHVKKININKLTKEEIVNFNNLMGLYLSDTTLISPEIMNEFVVSVDARLIADAERAKAIKEEQLLLLTDEQRAAKEASDYDREHSRIAKIEAMSEAREDDMLNKVSEIEASIYEQKEITSSIISAYDKKTSLIRKEMEDVLSLNLKDVGKENGVVNLPLKIKELMTINKALYQYNNTGVFHKDALDIVTKYKVRDILSKNKELLSDREYRELRSNWKWMNSSAMVKYLSKGSYNVASVLRNLIYSPVINANTMAVSKKKESMERVMPLIANLETSQSWHTGAKEYDIQMNKIGIISFVLDTAGVKIGDAGYKDAIIDNLKNIKVSSTLNIDKLSRTSQKEIIQSSYDEAELLINKWIDSGFSEIKFPMTKAERALYDEFQKILSETRGEVSFMLNSIYGLKRDLHDGYFPRIVKGKGKKGRPGEEKEGINLFDELLSPNKITEAETNKIKSSFGKERVIEDNKDYIYDTNFANIMDKYMESMYFHINASYEMKLISKLLSSTGEFSKWVGSGNVSSIKNSLRSSFDTIVSNTYSDFGDGLTGAVMKNLFKGTNSAQYVLSSVSQLAKQFIAPSLGAIAKFPTTYAKGIDNINKIGYSNIENFIKDVSPEVYSRNFAKENYAAYREIMTSDSGKFSLSFIDDWVTKKLNPIVKGDRAASFFIFIQSLTNQGWKYGETPTAEQVSKAQIHVDEIMGTTATEFSPDMLRAKGSISKKLFLATFMPFKNIQFSILSNALTDISNVKYMMLNESQFTSEEKQELYQSLGKMMMSLFASQLAFELISDMFRGVINHTAEELYGGNDDEDSYIDAVVEPIVERLNNPFETFFKTNIGLALSGAITPIEEWGKYGFNEAENYLENELYGTTDSKDSFFVSSGKDKSEAFFKSIGTLGIGLKPIFEAIVSLPNLSSATLTAIKGEELTASEMKAINDFSKALLFSSRILPIDAYRILDKYLSFSLKDKEFQEEVYLKYGIKPSTNEKDLKENYEKYKKIKEYENKKKEIYKMMSKQKEEKRKLLLENLSK